MKFLLNNNFQTGHPSDESFETEANVIFELTSFVDEKKFVKKVNIKRNFGDNKVFITLNDMNMSLLCSLSLSP